VASSRTGLAIINAGFSYARFAVGLIAGFVVFPLVVQFIGARDYGLWLASGELVGYLFLVDFGVFEVLPWIIAQRDGAQDLRGIAECLMNALAISLALAAVFVIAAAGLWYLPATSWGAGSGTIIRYCGPLSLLMGLTAATLPFRPFLALLVGRQDVLYAGYVSLVQSLLTPILTVAGLWWGWGLYALVVAGTVPAFLTGVFCLGRTLTRHHEVVRGWPSPTGRGCTALAREGCGPWFGMFGVRLLTASNGVVYASLGHADWTTILVATSKAAQASQPLCWMIPDSGLVGLSQLHGTGESARSRKVALCLVLLYLLIPGAAAICLLAANPWFVEWWVGPQLYAGHYVSGLVALNMLLWSVVSGTSKVVAVVGYRMRVGLGSIVFGLFAAGFGYLLARTRGLPGMVEGTFVAGIVFALPYGLWMLMAAHRLTPSDVFQAVGGLRIVLIVPWFIAAAWLGGRLVHASWLTVGLSTTVLVLTYLWCIRPLLREAPWPERVRSGLQRLRWI
jgi:hypothetical protein